LGKISLDALHVGQAQEGFGFFLPRQVRHSENGPVDLLGGAKAGMAAVIFGFFQQGFQMISPIVSQGIIKAPFKISQYNEPTYSFPVRGFVCGS
jgi:hypothetical protein